MKLDHYEKRYEIYDITLEFIQELSGNGADKQLHRSFIDKKESAKFLFSYDESIYQLLNEIHEKSIAINTHKSEKKDKGGDDIVELGSSKQFNENVSWMLDVAIQNLRDKMKPYLSLSAY